MFSWIDPETYAPFEPVSRSLRIEGESTSVRLERIYWNVLEEIARECGVKTGDLVSDLYREVYGKNDHFRNFASVLRVVCVQYLTRESGGKPAEGSGPHRDGQPGTQ